MSKSSRGSGDDVQTQPAKVNNWYPDQLHHSNSMDSVQAAMNAAHQAEKRAMFANQDLMKEKVWEALKKPEYNVADFYYKTGLWRTIATNPIFENLTLGVISFNALWIAIDTDNNPAPTLLDAQPLFQIVEHFFCWYFSFEWWVRFSSFKKKRNGLKDAWFVFDSSLVFMMVAETWVMTFVFLLLGPGGSGSAMGNASILRLFRLLRLSRLARMLRSMPELMILIKGMLAASRSVFFTMCLLLILLYLFAIAMRQLTEGTPVGHMYFYSVTASMGKLLIEGVFLDNLGTTTQELSDSGWVFVIIFYVFVCMAALMVMNMLIGVLCEVVSAVAATEKEEMNVLALKSKLAEVMYKLDTNQSGTLSEEEFVQLVSDSKAVTLLNEVGVDPIGLIDMAPSIFEVQENEDEDVDDEGASRPPKEIDFQEFMNLVLELRGSNAASVKDLREMKNELMNEIENLKMKLNMGRRRSSLGQSQKINPDSLATGAGPTLRRTDSSSTAASMGATISHVPTDVDTSRQSSTADMNALRSRSKNQTEPAPVMQDVVASPLRQAAALQVEDLSPGGPGEGNGAYPDLKEVECALKTLHAALGKVQRPSVPGVATGDAEKDALDWVESMGMTAETELKRLLWIRSQQQVSQSPSKKSTA